MLGTTPKWTKLYKRKKQTLTLDFSVQGRQKNTDILLNQKCQMAERHTWVCFQSRTSNTLHLDAVTALTPDLQAVLVIMGAHPLSCVWIPAYLNKFLSNKLREKLSGLLGCAWRALWEDTWAVVPVFSSSDPMRLIVITLLIYTFWCPVSSSLLHSNIWVGMLGNCIY